MKLILVFLLIGAIHLVNSSSDDTSSRQYDFLNDVIESEAGMARSRRALMRQVCGQRLFRFAFYVCGGACTAGTDVDLSTRCCGAPCSEDFIRTACCPDVISA